MGDSNKFYTDDIGKLATKAIESCAEDFLNTMQMKFTDIVETVNPFKLILALMQAPLIQCHLK